MLRNPAVSADDTPYYFIVEKIPYERSTSLKITIIDDEDRISLDEKEAEKTTIGQVKDVYGYIKATSPYHIRDRLSYPRFKLRPETNETFYNISSSRVEVAKDHGPLIYDLMMEIITVGDGYLVSDTEVSQDAAKIWEYYFHKRPDVNKKLITDINPQLEDSFKFSSGIRQILWERLGKKGPNPFLYAYQKFPSTLLTLEKRGRILLLPQK